MFSFIECLRAIAVALITNSHFKGVYPNDILSFGGGLGLALFFVISGFLLANIKEDTKFTKWYFKKIARLWVPLWIVRIIEIAVGYRDITSIQEFLKAFVFPGAWFTGAIAVLYILFFCFVKFIYNKKGNIGVYGAVVVLVALYLILFVTKAPLGMFSISHLRIENVFSVETPYLISQTIWFSCMLLGLYIRKNSKTEEKEKKHNIKMLFLSGAFVGLFFIIKVLTAKPQFAGFECLLAVSYVGFAYSIFNCFMGIENTCHKILKSPFGKIISVLSTCSLEIYYTQFLLISKLKNIIFPVNFVALCITIIISSHLVHWLSNKIINFKKVK